MPPDAKPQNVVFKLMKNETQNKLSELCAPGLIQTAEEKFYDALISSFFPKDGITHFRQVSKKDLDKAVESLERLMKNLPEELRFIEFVD